MMEALDAALWAGLTAGAAVAGRALMRARVRRLSDWMRRVRAPGEPAGEPPARGLLAPLAREAVTLARELADARAAAENEARLRERGDSLWTPERLREHVRRLLGASPLIVASNREPYRHVRRGRAARCEVPASGLVTGLEPLLRACGGTWVAHGDGDADFETADLRGRLRVPPDSPQYLLRRLKLPPEEAKGHYDGFSNEGLWPLCHIAHIRPLFRADDWLRYAQVNARFADAAAEEAPGPGAPFVLVQDYHLALMPELLRRRRPDARIALFWHIPWPNPEAFGICPWQRELLEGMLGADVIGFHTQYHCNNFLDTVDRALECRIDRERFAVRRGTRSTAVRALPIGVAVPEDGEGALGPDARRRTLAEEGVAAELVALGVDRLDYTKGILERFRGVERLLELRPELRGRFTLLQVGAPSRTALARYRGFVDDVRAEARRVNARFPGGAPAIDLRDRAHERAELLRLYRAADVCVVSSLHDGMNLVAKEFVASRGDERGALVLSVFTGAARELEDALLVNPYDADGVAAALGRALEMSDEEQRRRMRAMRRQVRERNVYRWAAALIEELAAVRAPAAR